MGCSASRCCRCCPTRHRVLPNGVFVPSAFKKVDSKSQLKNQKLEIKNNNDDKTSKEKDEKEKENKNERKNSSFDYFMKTNISLEWLLEQIGEKFKAEFTSKPTWIIERLNQYTEKDIDKTLVIRVTFGWDHENLPKSVVLKISNKRLDSESQSERMAANLFKKECKTYEWLQTVRRVKLPMVHLIRSSFTMANEEPLIFMEDLTERSKCLELEESVHIDLIKDLLKQLAQIHAASLVKKSEWVKEIDPNPPLFYQELAELVQLSTQGWNTIGELRFKKMLELSSGEYMNKIVKNACGHFGVDSCLVHGNPIARNFFASHDDKHIVAIVDWVQAHPGCFAEDVTKAICWNLSPKERHANQRKLLEHYHFNLLKYSEGKANKITIEVVEAGFRWFLPFAAVCYLIYLPDDLSHASIKQMERAQALLDEGLEESFGIAPAASVLQGDGEDGEGITEETENNENVKNVDESAENVSGKKVEEEEEKSVGKVMEDGNNNIIEETNVTPDIVNEDTFIKAVAEVAQELDASLTTPNDTQDVPADQEISKVIEATDSPIVAQENTATTEDTIS
ncbi:unnamed protein product [Bursaphelenchus xylophilus]|uniref:(pine wood nematode) hypothetical protein n=1 Tax=Bursaphelenchus xylophilus TaxID=6326 RepID=A0A1I7RUL5_BURXY|nr:unnamed protein product [Bursaphelenchus xylophilus]CAG9114205.1 unnamed protein product [Bursaphelenchus xylophilus]